MTGFADAGSGDHRQARRRELLAHLRRCYDRPDTAPPAGRALLEAIDVGEVTCSHRVTLEPPSPGSMPRAGSRHDAASSDRALVGHLFEPRSRAARSVVLFVHGHHAPLDLLVGRRRPTPGYLGCQWSFPRLAAEAGHLCLVPEVRAAEATRPADGSRSECHLTALEMLARGRSLQAGRLDEIDRWLAWLETIASDRRSPADHRASHLPVVVAGLSLGGELALLSSVFRPTVAGAAIAGFVRPMRPEVRRRAFCPCFYVPGVLERCDVPEIAALVAPRPLLVQHGRLDPSIPPASARSGIDQAQRLHLAAGGSFTGELVPGGHVIDPRRVLRWIDDRVADRTLVAEPGAAPAGSPGVRPDDDRHPPVAASLRQRIDQRSEPGEITRPEA